LLIGYKTMISQVLGALVIYLVGFVAVFILAEEEMIWYLDEHLSDNEDLATVSEEERHIVLRFCCAMFWPFIVYLRIFQ
jgi:dolichyl-phosphate-mannose--protein O-mannosyl transferase